VAPYVSGYLVSGWDGEHPSLTMHERLAALRIAATSKEPHHTLVTPIDDNALPNNIYSL